MTPFAIAGVQMHVTTHSNIDAMRHRLDLLMHLYPWVQMVLFSELACYGPLLQNAQPLPGAGEEAIEDMAARHRVWLISGSMYERREGAIYNTTSVIDPQGKIVGRYRKMFPFLPLEQGVAPGTEFLTFDVPEVGKFGVLNCYDIWFPEVARTLSAMGAEVLLHPVLTHTIDRDIDLAVAHATAAMFQCYVFDINGLVAGGNGHSAVFDPAGRVMYRADVLDRFIPIDTWLSDVRRVSSRVCVLCRSVPGFFLPFAPIAQPRRDKPPSNVAPTPTRPRMIG